LIVLSALMLGVLFLSAASFAAGHYSTGEAGPPTVLVSIGGISIEEGDYIGKRPRFQVLITDEAQVDAASVRVYLDGDEVVYTTVTSTPTRLEIEYRPISDLAADDVMEHVFKVEAADGAGNVTTCEAGELRVSYAGAALVSPMIASPAMVAPGQGESVIIAYYLNKDAAAKLMVFSPVGSVVWNRAYAEGSNGGKAGYNAVGFNAVSDIDGMPLANGIYVYRLMAEGKVMGKGYVVVYE